jgi:DNA polymerase-3 subunit beta
MKLTLERAALLSSLGHIQSVVERRNTIPLLSNVEFVAAEGHLSLAATNLDLALRESVPAEVERGGGTTTPAHMLYDIVRKLPDGAQIEFSQDGEGERLSLRAGRSEFSLPCLPREDFPVISEGELPVQFELATADLKRLIDKTRFAISTEETRYYLNGIHIHRAERDGVAMLRSVATDGHRLAKVEMPLPEGAAALPAIIIPRKAVQEVRKLIDQGEGAVAIAVSETRIRFAFGAAVLTSKLIDGTFPDYERVIPENNDKSLEVETGAFAEAVDRVSTIATETSQAVKLSLDDGALVVSAASPESGSANENVPVVYAGEALEVGFNARYLLEIARQIDDEKLRMLFADSISPMLVEDASDPGALYVLMPMRV